VLILTQTDLHAWLSEPVTGAAGPADQSLQHR
jgi:hypothetical protein